MYRDFYGLAGCPFEPTPDPAFYFESTNDRQALIYLGCALAQGEGFVIVTGEAGVGKSILMAHLLAAMGPVALRTAQLSGGTCDGDDIIPSITRGFGLVADTANFRAVATIESFLHQQARAGRRCLLIVDEAHKLSIAALEQLCLLSDFRLGARPLLQIVLVGQTKFRSRLKRHPALKPLRDRVLASHHLAPLAPVEVEPYIRHRLGCAGWNGRPSFGPGVHAVIHRQSGGVPQHINRIVKRLLQLGATHQKERIDGVMLSHLLAQLRSENGRHLVGPARIEPAEANLSVLLERVADLEHRAIEQERTIHHTLAVMIEWIENDAGHRVMA